MKMDWLKIIGIFHDMLVNESSVSHAILSCFFREDVFVYSKRYLSSVEDAKDASSLFEFHGCQRANFRFGLEDTTRGQADGGRDGAATATIAGRVGANAATPHIT